MNTKEWEMDFVIIEEQSFEIDKKDIDKASSTWSGFLYQGKVAIYTVLKYLNHLNIAKNEMKRYQIEIEYLEDFAILKDGVHVSLHQVKAKPNTDTIGAYNEANLNLLGKLASYPTIEEVNLHTAVAIKEYTKEYFIKTLSGFDVSAKKKELKTYKRLIFDNGKFEELYSKLKISCNDGMVPIERVIEIEKIQDLILSEIESFYSKCEDKRLRDQNSTVKNKSYVYSNFLNLIEDLVHKDHLKLLENQKIIINFEDFVNILEDDNIFSLNKRTVSSLLIHMISNDFNQYCADYDVKDDDGIIFSAWENHMKILKEFKPDDFYLLCRKLTPHLITENKDMLSIDEFREIMQPDGVRDSFIHALITLGPKIDEPIDLPSAYTIQEKGKLYILSTINRRGPKAHNTVGKQIYENLSKDDEMFEMLFEMDGYINSQINDVFTGDITRIQSDDSSDVITEEDRKQTITSQKTISFLQVDKLKEAVIG